MANLALIGGNLGKAQLGGDLFLNSGQGPVTKEDLMKEKQTRDKAAL